MPSEIQGGRPERAEIESWMREQLAIRLHMPASEIDTAQPLAYYGVDSMMRYLASYTIRFRNRENTGPKRMPW